ncbi:MAG TPA: FAD binding domain-containing protein [Anaerolineaceae bacterium]
MSYWKQYYIAQSIADALETLASSTENARLIAGGTDLLLDIQQGKQSPVDLLVDVSQIPEMKLIEIRNERIFLGAAVTIAEIACSPLIQKNAAALSDACSLIGGPQVRNSATIGGNVAHALPAADGVIALVALDASAVIANQDGERETTILSLFRGPGVSSLDCKKELITGFYVNLLRAGQGSAFARVMRPQGIALPILNMAIFLHQRNGIINTVKIAVGPAGSTPQRATRAETFLTGKSISSDLLTAGSEEIRKSLHFRSSPYRATAGYRTHLSGILFEEVFTKVWQRVSDDCSGSE